MRILHLYPADPDDPFGPEAAVRLHEIARRLAQHHAVSVVAPASAGPASETVRDGVRYHRLPLGRWGRLGHAVALARWLRRQPADLWIDELVPGHAVPWGRWLWPAGRRVIASLHGVTPAVERPRPWATLRGCRDVIVPSASIRERVEALPGTRRIEIVPNGVDDALFRLPAQRGSGLLHLGRVDLRASGVDLLLQAYARVPKAQREPLTLAGPVHDPEGLQSLLQQAGLAGQVQVLGACDARKRLQLLAECRAVVVPARRDGSLLAVAQANAAGRPVVVWDQAPLAEAASRACLRVPPFDVPAFAQALSDVLQASRDELQLRGLHARAHARRYDWDSAADTQERFYLRCLDDPAADGLLSVPESFDATG
jgi:glycosyltransferase involved in cell wall biosynthesis